MKAIIVGAGLAGLTCALGLRRQGLDVTVLEANVGVGGCVRTDQGLPYTLRSVRPASGHTPHLPDNSSTTPNLFSASEFTEAGSRNAAMISGEKAAAAIVNQMGARRFEAFEQGI